MKKNVLVSSLLTGASLIMFSLASCSEDQVTEPLETVSIDKKLPQDILNKLMELGESPENIRYSNIQFPGQEAQESIGFHDMLIDKTSFMNMEANDPSGRQSRTPFIIDTDNHGDLRYAFYSGSTVNVGDFDVKGFTEQAAVDKVVEAIAKWNNAFQSSFVNLQVVGIREVTDLADWNPDDETLIILRNYGFEDGITFGEARFPSDTGKAGNLIQFEKTFFEGPFADNTIMAQTAIHEIGHTIGFRHTDWDTRGSCGENNPESFAETIPFTPGPYFTQEDSVMNSCPTASDLNILDEIALIGLYGFSYEDGYSKN